jgi:diguanylate cyclase (GGDEF)-like protein/PAS domain S-box-containing protein
MKNYHPLLKNQIQQHFGETIPDVKALQEFITHVNNVYWRLQPPLQYERYPSTSPEALSYVHYQHIFDAAGIALAILDDNAVILFANREFEKMSGYPLADINGKKSLAEFFSPLDFEQAIGHHKSHGAGLKKRTYRMEARLSDKKGFFHPVLLSLAPIEKTSLHIASFIDISEQKKIEQALLHQQTELSRTNDRLRSLHELSAVLTRTLNLKALLTDALHTITHMELLRLEPKGMIFTFHETHLHLDAHLGLSDAMVRAHVIIEKPEELCGYKDTDSCKVRPWTELHKNCPAGIQKIGHRTPAPLLVALRSRNVTVGMMCLFPKWLFQMDSDVLELLQIIANQIAIVSENALLYEKTRSLSLHDHLTGLPNRRFLQLEIERNFAKSKRYKTNLSVLMLDIDNFKRFNDTNGHIAGDTLLADIARIILREVRETDLAARYGGEEFLVLLPETNFQRAFEIAERLRISIFEKTSITVSIGVSAFSESLQSPVDMINDADRALYAAKAHGKNRVEGIYR